MTTDCKIRQIFNNNYVMLHPENGHYFSCSQGYSLHQLQDQFLPLVAIHLILG